jgi:hypothetical protein
MKIKLLALLSVLMLVALAGSAAAQNKPYTPAKGSAERTVILDAIRAERGGANVVYTPRIFLVQNGYAWVVAKAANTTNQYEDEIALLRKSGSTWKWVDAPCVEEACVMSREIRKLQRKYPTAPKAIFKVK